MKPMDHFDDITLFRFFLSTPKNKRYRPMCLAKFGRHAKFHRNPLQTHAPVAPHKRSLSELASFGSHFSMCKRRILTKLRVFATLGLVNRSMEAFLYVKSTKNCLYFVTSKIKRK